MRKKTVVQMEDLSLKGLLNTYGSLDEANEMACVYAKNKPSTQQTGLGGLKRRVCLHVAVNLLRFTVSSEQSAKNSHPSHPGYLLRHSSIGSTLSLTCGERGVRSTVVHPGRKSVFYR